MTIDIKDLTREQRLELAAEAVIAKLRVEFDLTYEEAEELAVEMSREMLEDEERAKREAN
jgi:hypothetical protein